MNNTIGEVEAHDNLPVVAEADNGLTPMVSPVAAAKAMEQYQELCKAVLNSDDFQKIGDKAFKKKSAFRKLSQFYGVSVEEIPGSEKMIDLGEENNFKKFAIAVSYLARSRGGHTASGDGACDNFEKGTWEKIWENNKPIRTGRLLEPASYHVTRSNAHTRAFNRAVSNLVAMGEVSADEINESVGVIEGASHTQSGSPSTSGQKISVPQARRMWAIAHNNDNGDKLLPYLKSQGFKDPNDVTVDQYESICKRLERSLEEILRSSER